MFINTTKIKRELKKKKAKETQRSLSPQTIKAIDTYVDSLHREYKRTPINKNAK